MRKSIIAIVLVALVVLAGPVGSVFAATPPSIYIITPASGSKDVGTDITIIGDNFKPDSAVIIGGLRASNVRAAACTDIGGGRLNCGILYATTPARGIAGSTSVIVLNQNGQAAYMQGGFTYY
jgi:hypothetical protein